MLPVSGLDPGVVGGRPPELGGGGPGAPDGLDVGGAAPGPHGAVPVRLAPDGSAGGGRGGGVLHDCRVVGQPARQGGVGLGRLADADVFDVRTAEDDVLVHLVPGGHRPVRGPVLGAEGTN